MSIFTITKIRFFNVKNNIKGNDGGYSYRGPSQFKATEFERVSGSDKRESKQVNLQQFTCAPCYPGEMLKFAGNDRAQFSCDGSAVVYNYFLFFSLTITVVSFYFSNSFIIHS